MDSIDRTSETTSRRVFIARGAASIGVATAGVVGLGACSSGGDDVVDAASPTGQAPGSNSTAAPLTTPAGAPATTSIRGDGSLSDVQSTASNAGLTPPGGPPPTTQSGFFWTDARILFVTVGVKPDGLGDWLPPGLRLVEPAEAVLFVAHYPMTNFGSVYNEAAVLLKVEDDDGPALHCPWMVVDDDTALVLGRELLGFPKTMAEITLVEEDGQMVGTVTRRGTELMRLEVATADLTDDPGPVWDTRLVNTFGSPVGGMRLIDIPPLPEEVHDRRRGVGAATLGRTDRDPLADWLVDSDGASAGAVYGQMDFADLTAAGTLSDEVMSFDYAFRMTIERAS